MSQQVYGVSVGGRIKVGFPKSGNKQDGTFWQLFTYEESRKNQQTGEYDKLGRYTIFVNNPIQQLQNGDTVIIKSITKATIEKNIGKDKKEYINVNCWCDIEMGAVYQPRLVDNQNQQPQLENTQMETPNFSDEFVDSLELPF